jgi:hypothetical protein
LEIRRKSSNDPYRIEIAESLSQIAKCYKALSYDHKALEHEKEALEIKQKFFNATHDQNNNIQIATSYQNLGRLHHNF